jgi:4-coumarate--CoA ligase
MDLISWIFQESSHLDDTPILLDAANPNRCLTYSQLLCAVKEVISGLQHAGHRPGDCVMVNAFNDVYYTVLYLGIIGSGGVFTGVNPSYTSAELLHHMKLTKPKFLVVEPDLLEKTLQAAKEIGLDTANVYAFDHTTQLESAAIHSWTELLNHGQKEWAAVNDPNRTVVQYASTSGTSGLPKAALIPHSYHVSQAQLICDHDQVPYQIRRLTALPPFHAFASPIIPASIRKRYPVYIMRRFEMGNFLQYVKEFQISETYLPPPVIIALPRHSMCNRSTMSSIRQIFFGGAPLKLAHREPLNAVLDQQAKIQPVWGMTEIGWITRGLWSETLSDESAARLQEGFEIRVLDENNNDVSHLKILGELVVKAPAPMLGYINNLTATKEIFAEDGWIRTGDLGYVKAGKPFVIDRKKDIIKVRTWQVSPAEIEAVLLQHPDIYDAAVIGITLNNGMGEVPKAFVVLLPGTKLKVRTIKKFIAGKLARYKIPEEIVFIDAIPKNPTGKILRRLLRLEGKTVEPATSRLEFIFSYWTWVTAVVLITALALFFLLPYRMIPA